MKTIAKKYLYGHIFVAMGVFTSCNEIEIPNHELDVEFKYELTCSEGLLKYVTPDIIITDATGSKRTLTIENSMWDGNEHKTWTYIVHYDSLNVSNTATVKYIPKAGVAYQDEIAFDNVHNLSCFISVKEDGDGRRNNYTIVPDFPSKTDVKADVLKDFINRLSITSSTRGGSVDLKGEIIKINED